MQRHLLLFLFSLITSLATTQSTLPAKITDSSWSLALSFIGEDLPEGVTYYPHMVLARHYLCDFSPGQHGFLIYGEPQLVAATLGGNARTEVEGGINLGIEYQLRFLKTWYLQAAIGTGPHYISVETDLQAKGFIFSDNFEIGLIKNLPQLATQLHLRTRFRHISNAGLKSPNLGIDSFFVVLGISRPLERFRNFRTF